MMNKIFAFTVALFMTITPQLVLTEDSKPEDDSKPAEDSGGSAAGWTMDVANADRVEQVTVEVADKFGGLDYLINNAGISRFAPIDAEDYEDQWAISVEVLLTAHTRTIRAALPYLRQSAAARIVNIASDVALWGGDLFAPESYMDFVLA